MNIAVFCSQYDVAKEYAQAAEKLGQLIAKGGHTLVWGGGDEGLMHIIAYTAQQGGARVVGVIREEIKHKAYKDADEMVVVKDTYEMNLGLIERGDVIVVLVGGVGTLNELTEVLRLKKNGRHDKPIIFVNIGGFYDGLKEQLGRMGKEGFVKKEIIDSLHFAGTPEEAMRYIEGNGN